MTLQDPAPSFSSFFPRVYYAEDEFFLVCRDVKRPCNMQKCICTGAGSHRMPSRTYPAPSRNIGANQTLTVRTVVSRSLQATEPPRDYSTLDARPRSVYSF